VPASAAAELQAEVGEDISALLEGRPSPELSSRAALVLALRGGGTAVLSAAESLFTQPEEARVKTVLMARKVLLGADTLRLPPLGGACT
jgi:hypothetical protein